MSFAENDGSREPSETIDEFCAVEHLSRSSYYKMRKLGYGPDEMVVPGTSIIRITPQAHREWRIKLEERSRTTAAVLERNRRADQRRAAGKAAAASPKHVSRRPTAAPARTTERRR